MFEVGKRCLQPQIVKQAKADPTGRKYHVLQARRTSGVPQKRHPRPQSAAAYKDLTNRAGKAFGS
jgi:hypothetical protein